LEQRSEVIDSNQFKQLQETYGLSLYGGGRGVDLAGMEITVVAVKGIHCACAGMCRCCGEKGKEEIMPLLSPDCCH
jgi:hypothetical protein